MSTPAPTLASPLQASTSTIVDDETKLSQLLNQERETLEAIRRDEELLRQQIEAKKAARREQTVAQAKQLLAQVHTAISELPDSSAVLAELGLVPTVRATARPQGRRSKHGKGYRLGESQYLEVRRATKARGAVMAHIAKRFGLSRQTVHAIRDEPLRVYAD